MKSVRIRSFSGPYFPAFGLNTGSYFVSLRIQSECEKTRTRKLRIRTFSRTCIFKKNNPSGIHNPFSITSFLKLFQISIFISLTSWGNNSLAHAGMFLYFRLFLSAFGFCLQLVYKLKKIYFVHLYNFPLISEENEMPRFIPILPFYYQIGKKLCQSFQPEFYTASNMSEHWFSLTCIFPYKDRIVDSVFVRKMQIWENLYSGIFHAVLSWEKYHQRRSAKLITTIKSLDVSTCWWEKHGIK